MLNRQINGQERNGFVKIGDNSASLGGNTLNKTIQTLLDHRSVRNYKKEPLSEEQVRLLVESAQSAATSSFLQTYSIIGVTDPAKRQALSEVGRSQQCIVDAGHFFVFCADLHRHEMAAEMHKTDVSKSLESTETFMVAIIDAALAAQSMVIAAESMGMGICYIGGLRNDARRVSDVLNLPDRVVPVFGLCVGYPETLPGQKPRLPFEHVYHLNGYEANPESTKEQLKGYDEMIEDYYKNRTDGQRTEGWTEQISKNLSNPVRLYMKEFLKEKKFPLD